MKHDLNNKNFERKAKRVYSVFACVAPAFWSPPQCLRWRQMTR